MKTVNNLSQMTDQQFVDFCKAATGRKGIFGATARLNTRGLQAFISKDKNGVLSFQTVKSDPVYKSGEFEQRVVDAGVERGSHRQRYARARAYDRIMAWLETSDFVAAIPKNSILAVELYSKDLPASAQPGRSRAIRRGANIGTNLTIFPYALYNATTMKLVNESRRRSVFAELYKTNPEQDTSVRIISPRMTVGNVNLESLTAVVDIDLSVLRTKSSQHEKDRAAYRKFMDRAKRWAEITIATSHQVAGKTRLGHGFGFVLETPVGSYVVSRTR